MIIVVLVVLVILFTLRRKNKKTTVLEQPQGAILESKDPFTMIRNDAYTVVIAAERNEAYVTNADVIPSSNEPCRETFEMTGNDAYSTAITTERNEAYMTNTDAIPAARNMAYGAVATELESGDSFHREDMNDAVYAEPEGQTAHDQSGEEYSYAFVR